MFQMTLNNLHLSNPVHRTSVQLASLVAFVTLVVDSGCGGRSVNNHSKAAAPSPTHQDQKDDLDMPPLAEALLVDTQVQDAAEAEALDESSRGYLSTLAQSISQAYQSAKSSGQTAATSARDWILNDINSGGRWEYRVIPTTEEDPAQLEELLNGLGRDGWECFHIESKGDVLMLFMQRHPTSITRNIPFGDLMKVLPYLGLGQGE
jgi:hypothetical protein